MFDIFRKILGQSAPESIQSDAFIVDVRSSGEFASGHVKGAVNIPLDQIASKLERFRGKSQIVVYCRSGMRSSQAKAILERNGLGPVINGGTRESVERRLAR